MTESLDIRRKRLRFRSWHRGTREMDLLLGSFAERYLDGFGAAELAQYEALLEIIDPDLFAWMTGKEEVPEPFRGEVMDLLQNFKYPAKNIEISS